MLSQSQRTTILELRAKGMNKREIAKLLNLSRQSVRKVLQANSTAVPKIEREEKAAPHRQRILELLHTCQGNLVRVHEKLLADGAALSYQALTAFCRRQGIGQEPIVPAGRYDFAPGEEWKAFHNSPNRKDSVMGRRPATWRESRILMRMCFSLWACAILGFEGDVHVHSIVFECVSYRPTRSSFENQPLCRRDSTELRVARAAVC